VKLVRLLLGSFGIMALGLLAVFGAILYKLAAPETTAPAASQALPRDMALGLPPGTRLLASALSGERALLTLDVPGEGTRLLLLDARDGRLVATIRLGRGE